MFIGISGIIGAGKTTLTTNLAKEVNYPTYYEPVKENAYLTDFYAATFLHIFYKLRGL